MNAHRLTFARRVSLKHCHQVLRCFSAIPLSADEVCKEPDCQSNRGAGPQSCHQSQAATLSNSLRTDPPSTADRRVRVSSMCRLGSWSCDGGTAMISHSPKAMVACARPFNLNVNRDV
jgi:hypothetical protein